MSTELVQLFPALRELKRAEKAVRNSVFSFGTCSRGNGIDAIRRCLSGVVAI